MKRKKLRGCLQNAALAAAAVLLTLCAVEAAVRVIWKDRPRHVQPLDDSIFSPGSFPREIMALRPGATGFHGLTGFRFNSLGYRGPEYPRRAAKGRFRIAVAGDSFIYGYSLKEGATLPAFLEKELKDSGINAEVINAGVPAYNLSQNVAHAHRIARDYSPDMVVISFIHNDLANTFYALGSGRLPVLTTSNETENPRRNFLGKASQLMLPVRAAGPVPFSVKLRFGVANVSAAYEYAAFLLHRAGNKYAPAQRKLTFPQTASRQTEDQIWTVARNNLRDFRKLSDSAGFEPVLMIYMDFRVEGRPILKLKKIAAEERVPVVDISPVWGGERNYMRKYAIAWDSHPNSRANAVAARVLGDALFSRRMIPAGPSAARRARYAAHEKAVAQRDARSRALARQQARNERELRARFLPELTAKGYAVRSPADQWLYGWWTEEPFTWDEGGGMWMSQQAAFFLRAPEGGASAVEMDGYTLKVPAGQKQPRLIFFCNPGKTAKVYGVPPGKFSIHQPLAARLEQGKIIECEFAATSATTPLALGLDTTDVRFISFAFTRLALK